MACIGLWCIYDAAQHLRTLISRNGGDGGEPQSTSDSLWGCICNIIVWICHYHCWLFKYQPKAHYVLYRHVKRKILGLKGGVWSSIIWLPCRDSLELLPHIFKHTCGEASHLPIWTAAKHKGANPHLLPRLTSHPAQEGKTPLARTGNKRNDSPGGCKLQFSQNKVGKRQFFWMANPFWGAVRSSTAIYCNLQKDYELWPKPILCKLNHFLYRTEFYQRPTAINHILREQEPQNIQQQSSISNGKRKRKKEYKEKLSWLSFSENYSSFSLVYLCQNSYFWYKTGKQVPNALYKCLHNIVLEL